VIVINGGGIIGSYLANKVARKTDEPVHVIEEHTDFHKTCSALLTKTVEQHAIIPNKYIINKIHGANIYAPNGKHITAKFKEPDITLDRDCYIQHLTEEAERKGVFFHKPGKVRKIITPTNPKSPIQLKIEHLKTKKELLVNPDKLIGADGALSTIGKHTGLTPSRRPHFVGFKAKAKKKNNNEIDFYPYIKDFAWTIPIDEETVEIGLAARKDVHKTFDNFCEHLQLKPYDKEAAIIPYYDPSQKIHTTKNKTHVALVGDAAGQVKATTGGGIVFGMRAANILADCITNNSMGTYPIKVKTNVGLELFAHRKLRQILDKINEKDWNQLVNAVSYPTIAENLGSVSRDELSKLIMKSAFQRPQLLLFAKLLFR